LDVTPGGLHVLCLAGFPHCDLEASKKAAAATTITKTTNEFLGLPLEDWQVENLKMSFGKSSIMPVVICPMIDHTI
jgi:hypothetical protein